MQDCTEAFYGGAVGGGKTAALLMAALQYVDVPDYMALILRRTFPELEQPDGPIRQSLRWFAQAPQAVRPVYNRTDHEWAFPSGALIKFGHLDNPNSAIIYQGGGYHFFGFDELTHFDEESYEFIGLSRTRRPPEGPLSKVPMRLRATANPGGPGHGWVKDRFITSRKPNVAFIPARLEDNPGIDYADYVSRLGLLKPTLMQQLLEGDWGVFEHQAFPKFGPPHLIQDFPLANSYSRFEAMDYGLNGTAWCLVAVDYDGNLIFYDTVTAKDLLPDEVAPIILAKREAAWGAKNTVHADPSIWHRTATRNRWGAAAVLADEFADCQLPLAQGNNDPRAGLIRLRTLMDPDPEHRFPQWHPLAGEANAPRLYVVSGRCGPLMKAFQDAPLQPLDKPDGGEKIDPEWESRHGHFTAMARYAVMSRPGPSKEPEPVEADPRRAFLNEVNKTENTRSTRYSNV